MSLRFFKCNVLGGFRLSDLNKQVKQGEYFYIESHITETSRAVIAALREKWMIEVSEKEASKSISIPFETTGVQELASKKIVSRSLNVAIPNVRDVNRNLESRQAELNHLSNSKPSIPNFKEVEESTKERQNDSLNKVGASSDQELLKGQKNIEQVATPDFSKIGKTKDQTTQKPELPKTEQPTITKLADDSVFDNSQVSVPNFDEKETVKEEIKSKIEEKVTKKRRILRKVAEAKE